jgi:hypothetical protein
MTDQLLSFLERIKLQTPDNKGYTLLIKSLQNEIPSYSDEYGNVKKYSVRYACKKYSKKYVMQPIQKEKSIKQSVVDDLSIAREKAKAKTLEAKYNHAIKLNQELEERYNSALQITEHTEEQTEILPIYNNDKKEEATAIILLSDWHFEETVEPETVNNINEYNTEIAKKRIFKCIQNSLKIIQKESASSNINQLVLWLGGDFISGYIHPELEEANSLSPIEAIIEIKKILINIIQFYDKHGKFNSITIPCNIGNHGRTTIKPKVSTSYKNSYEWMLYHELKIYFKGNKKIKFIIPNGIYTYVTIYDKVCRFFHGDHIKFGGGIGGLSIPLIKAIMRADQQQKAYYNFMGHYHQFWEAAHNCLVNGSIIGYGAYAQRIGASPEQPIQALRIMDKKRGLTAKFPIFCN